jgi:arsenite methyltransferase
MGGSMMGDDVKQKVLEKYARAALDVREESEGGGSCCGGGAACSGAASSEAFEVGMILGAYSEAEKGEWPVLAAEASLGCGNPVSLATLSSGGTALNFGSGGGMTCCSRRGGWRRVARLTAWT